MFKHSGAKLKGWADLLAGLGILLAIAFAFYYFTSVSDGSGVMTRLGLVALAVYCLCLYLALLILYALGDASDNTALILEKLERLEARERARERGVALKDKDDPVDLVDPEALRAMLTSAVRQEGPRDEGPLA